MSKRQLERAYRGPAGPASVELHHDGPVALAIGKSVFVRNTPVPQGSTKVWQVPVKDIDSMIMESVITEAVASTSAVVRRITRRPAMSVHGLHSAIQLHPPSRGGSRCDSGADPQP
ncbi:hypothetical protein GCM10022222_01490 [Amycolatopsis ultiminotia]|uniref:Uncharacterized protein n=1 Tax=Amycolatopsis ultiminotia TaxID=543629 RepID=A0ABP6UV67_9PSEU